MVVKLLPEQFRDLEKYAETWAQGTEAERQAILARKTMTEINEFYDTMRARVGDAFDYLRQFPIPYMSEQAERLFYMTVSLAEVADVVEYYRDLETDEKLTSIYEYTNAAVVDQSC